MSRRLRATVTACVLTLLAAGSLACYDRPPPPADAGSGDAGAEGSEVGADEAGFDGPGGLDAPGIDGPAADLDPGGLDAAAEVGG